MCLYSLGIVYAYRVMLSLQSFVKGSYKPSAYLSLHFVNTGTTCHSRENIQILSLRRNILPNRKRRLVITNVIRRELLITLTISITLSIFVMSPLFLLVLVLFSPISRVLILRQFVRIRSPKFCRLVVMSLLFARYLVRKVLNMLPRRILIVRLIRNLLLN